MVFLLQLEAFLKMRQFELSSLENSNTVTFLFLEGMDDHTVKSISPILADVQAVLEKATDELLQHLYQLKHSEKYVFLSIFVFSCFYHSF